MSCPLSSFCCLSGGHFLSVVSETCYRPTISCRQPRVLFRSPPDPNLQVCPCLLPLPPLILAFQMDQHSGLLGCSKRRHDFPSFFLECSLSNQSSHQETFFFFYFIFYLTLLNSYNDTVSHKYNIPLCKCPLRSYNHIKQPGLLYQSEAKTGQTLPERSTPWAPHLLYFSDSITYFLLVCLWVDDKSW